MRSIFPTITVVIATFNSENTLGRCLKSVRSQNYPQEKINIILSDGGSSDRTFQIAKDYNVSIISIPPHLQNAEYNKGVAVRKAKGELLLMIDHDNILPHDKWIRKMLEPLIEDEEIVAVETLRYNYNQKRSLLDRYFALFGAGDPLAFYLGKADRLSFIYDNYNLLGESQDMGRYYVVRFKQDKIPTLGANGFLIRRIILVNNAMVDEKHFFHIDVNVDLIRKGFNKYAFIKDDIVHLTGYKNISSFLYRRKLFMEQFHIKNHLSRRYSVYMPKDKIRLLVFVLYALTFLKPTYDSIRGYIKIHDLAWFLHPILSFTLFSIYFYVIIKTKFILYAKRLF